MFYFVQYLFLTSNFLVIFVSFRLSCSFRLFLQILFCIFLYIICHCINCFVCNLMSVLFIFVFLFLFPSIQLLLFSPWFHSLLYCFFYFHRFSRFYFVCSFILVCFLLLFRLVSIKRIFLYFLFILS